MTRYRGITDTLVSTMREEGVRAIYRGLVPTLLGIAPYTGPPWLSGCAGHGGARWCDTGEVGALQFLCT